MPMEERRIPILVAGATCTGHGDKDSLTDRPGSGFGVSAPFQVQRFGTSKPRDVNATSTSPLFTQ